jgi:hypothetical protein
MSDLHKALADISRIRVHLAAGTTFRGFGPAVIAVSGLLTVAVAIGQSGGLLLAELPLPLLVTWVVVAIAASLLIGIEMRARTASTWALPMRCCSVRSSTSCRSVQQAPPS